MIGLFGWWLMRVQHSVERSFAKAHAQYEALFDRVRFATTRAELEVARRELDLLRETNTLSSSDRVCAIQLGGWIDGRLCGRTLT